LYELKQEPRAWYAMIDSYLMRLGFTKSDAYFNLYYKFEDGFPLILVLYVDDLFLTRDEKLIDGCKRDLTLNFKMKDLVMMHYFLGLEVWQRPDDIFLSQGKYTMEIMQRFRMMDCKSIARPMVMNQKLLIDSSSYLVDPTMYRQLVGSLMYLVNTRTDICFAVNTLIQYMVEPGHVHLIATNHVLRYLHGTVGYGIRYVSDGEVNMKGYIDYDWAGSVVDQKSTSGCCFGLGSGMISWLEENRRQWNSVQHRKSILLDY
jgi:hypothetical protein